MILSLAQLALLLQLPDSPADGLRCVGWKKITARKLVALGLARCVGAGSWTSAEYFVRTSEGAAAATKEKSAWLHIQDWAGHLKQAVTIVGETSTRYRITPASTERVKLGGRSRWLAPGKTALVPKTAVTARET